MKQEFYAFCDQSLNADWGMVEMHEREKNQCDMYSFVINQKRRQSTSVCKFKPGELEVPF